VRFAGDHAFLSNFHPSAVEWMGLPAATVEHAFQTAKTLDVEERQAIANAPTPGAAKRLGRAVVLRPGWEESKRAVMAALLLQKFTRHAELAKALLSTGNAELVEGNTWGDAFWGVCAGRGHNELGRQLMAVRAMLRSLAGTSPAQLRIEEGEVRDAA
jgi:ribA/ribD-fused uncharacterized protein